MRAGEKGEGGKRKRGGEGEIGGSGGGGRLKWKLMVGIDNGLHWPPHSQVLADIRLTIKLASTCVQLEGGKQGGEKNERKKKTQAASE